MAPAAALWELGTPPQQQTTFYPIRSWCSSSGIGDRGSSKRKLVGNTLDRAILEVPSSRKTENRNPSTASSKPKTTTPFCGGELVFLQDRVTLCGVVVVEGRTRMRKILELLREKRPGGKYVAYTGEKLATKLGITAGENAVSEAVKRFRDTAVERLEAKGIVCGRKDARLSGGVGYRLAETITLRGESG